MRTVQQAFESILRVGEMRDEGNWGPHQVGAAGITFNRIPSDAHGLISAYYILENISPDFTNEEYDQWLRDRISGVDSILTSDEEFSIKGEIAKADWYFREAYSNHKWAEPKWYDINFDKVFEALVVYLMFGVA